MIADIQTGQPSGELVRSLPIEALPTSANGWPPRPFQIVSLLDVIKFPAEKYLTAASILSAIDQGALDINANLVIDDTNRQAIVEQFTTARSLCEALGVEYTIDEIDFVLKRLAEPTLTYGDFAAYPMSTSRRMRDEISRRMCVLIPVEDCKYYKQVALFGERVALKFPSGSGDIEAAGNCYATDSPTACVMHSMRVLELGIGALAKQFHVSFQHSSWDKIIGQVEKKTRQIEAKKRKPKNWHADRQFYSEAAIHFRFLKDAWRNYAMHVHEDYDKPSALTTMNHVHEFMDHISERLHE
jgi:hypothetical protein